MKIAFHTDCYAFSGSETTLMLLLADAARSGAPVTFTYRRSVAYEAGLARHLPAEIAAAVAAEGLRLPDPSLVGHDGRRRLLALVGARHLAFAVDVARFWVRYRRLRPDVVHVNNGGYPGAVSCRAAAVAARLAGVPNVVMVVNNLAEGYDRPARRADRPVDRLVERSVTRFVTGSRAAGDQLGRVLGVPADRRTVLPNGVAARPPRTDQAVTRAAHGIGADELVIAVVARLEARKGHRHLIDALGLLPAATRARVRVLVAGDGPEREALAKQVADRGLAHVVTLVGEHPDPWSIYAAADVVALPSVGHEDQPITLIEALAAGRPTVATRVAGAAEVVDDGTTGLLVDPGDPAALASALDALLGDPDRRAAMGEAAVARYDAHFTPERVVAGYRDLYSDLYSEPACEEHP